MSIFQPKLRILTYFSTMVQEWYLHYLTFYIFPKETDSALSVFSKFYIWSLAQSCETGYKWFYSFYLPSEQALG